MAEWRPKEWPDANEVIFKAEQVASSAMLSSSQIFELGASTMLEALRKRVPIAIGTWEYIPHDRVD